MADADDYLQEGFDPRGVTVPRLRSILVTHNVEYPATAKKPQLVELVNDHVLPQVPKLRLQRDQAKRSSLGIVNAGSAEDNGKWDDYDLAPPPPSTRSRRSMSPRKSSARVKTEEDEVTPTPFRSTTKRSSRSVSRPLSSRFEDDHTPRFEAPKSALRGRRTVTPQIKAESEEPEEPEESEESEPEEKTPVAHVAEESVFTDDNPFQSRSSPAHLKTPSRRRMAGEDIIRSEKPARRRTDSLINQAQTPKPYGLPVSKTRHRSPDFSLDPGEEFTPDAQLELEEAASRGEVSIAPPKPSKPVRKTSIKTPLLVLFISLVGAYLAWYRQEKIAVGYCGLGRATTQKIPPEVPVPDFLVPFVEPQCEPCPPHAYCYQDFSVRCHADFILQSHPLSFGGLVPLPPTCEPDSEKSRRVHAVADKAIEELRERRAKYECGELVDEDGQQVGSPAIAEEELKQTVSMKRNKRLNSEEFEDLWVAAIGEITTREEVVVEVETTTTTSNSSSLPISKLSSSSLARLPITCAFKRSVRLGLARYRLSIGLLMSLVLATFYLRARYRKHLATSAQVPALVDLVLERLANQKELGEEDLDDPWLFLPNLRDDVLRSVHSLSERERIWQRVKVVVEQNSNVRTGQREGRSGEVGRAWEWIGPVKGDAVRRRRSGRVSWAPEAATESPDPKGATAAAESAGSKRWEEPRPIY